MPNDSSFSVDKQVSFCKQDSLLLTLRGNTETCPFLGVGGATLSSEEGKVALSREKVTLSGGGGVTDVFVPQFLFC